MKQSILARLGHQLSVRRARIEEQKYARAEAMQFKNVALKSESLNQRLQAEMLDAEYFESLRQSNVNSVIVDVPVKTRVTKKSKSGLAVRLVQTLTGIF